jgi:collagenase-like PrtC family protease
MIGGLNMASLEFSVPYNGDPTILDSIFSLKNLNNNKVTEIFLSGPQEYFGSGRITSELKLNDFQEIINNIHRHGIKANLVLNSICGGDNWYSPEEITNVLKYIGKLHEEYGLEAVTLSNPIYMKTIREQFSNLEICASVLSDIDSVQKALIFREAGVDTITPDANINRNLDLLRDIKSATGVKLKIMVNEGCLYKCPFRKFHFNYISHRSKSLKRLDNSSYDFPKNCCVPVIQKDPSQILKSGWIRPEDVCQYKWITNFFKIVGRETPTHRTLRVIKAYLNEEWEGDLLDIMCSSLLSYSLKVGTYLDNKRLGEIGFWDRITTCNKKCDECRYCEKIINDHLMLGWATTEKLRDQGFDKDADEMDEQENILNES